MRETFEERTDVISGDDGGRALRGIEWTWDPDPNDATYSVDYAFVLRDDDGTTSVHHEQHVEGLFPKATWLGILTAAGFVHETAQCFPEGLGSEIFLARRP